MAVPLGKYPRLYDGLTLQKGPLGARLLDWNTDSECHHLRLLNNMLNSEQGKLTQFWVDYVIPKHTLCDGYHFKNKCVGGDTERLSNPLKATQVESGRVVRQSGFRSTEEHGGVSGSSLLLSMSQAGQALAPEFLCRFCWCEVCY